MVCFAPGMDGRKSQAARVKPTFPGTRISKAIDAATGNHARTLPVDPALLKA
jgi:hypothetical protein